MRLDVVWTGAPSKVRREEKGARDDRREVGAWGESRAADFLTSEGFEIVARNWRRRGGELDLVALDGERLVFVEVRTLRYGVVAPEETVVLAKRRQLARVAKLYLQENPRVLSERVVCFDVVGVRWPSGRVRHIRSAFEISDL